MDYSTEQRIAEKKQIYEQSIDALRKANAHLYIDSLNPVDAVKLMASKQLARFFCTT